MIVLQAENILAIVCICPMAWMYHRSVSEFHVCNASLCHCHHATHSVNLQYLMSCHDTLYTCYLQALRKALHLWPAAGGIGKAF